jgi:hypothetical protein
MTLSISLAALRDIARLNGLEDSFYYLETKPVQKPTGEKLPRYLGNILAGPEAHWEFLEVLMSNFAATACLVSSDPSYLSGRTPKLIHSFARAAVHTPSLCVQFAEPLACRGNNSKVPRSKASLVWPLGTMTSRRMEPISGAGSHCCLGMTEEGLESRSLISSS